MIVTRATRCGWTTDAVALRWLLLLLLLLLPGATVQADDVEETLRDSLEPLLATHEGVVAAAVRHLETGKGFASSADRPMPTASLVKAQVMVAVR
jgi:beta-lactamase class A